MSDQRLAMVNLAKEHIANPIIKNIAQWLVSDQSSHFYEAPFNNFSGKWEPHRWSSPGGLVEATRIGYQPLRILLETAKTIYTTPSVDRVVAIYLSLMISRSLDVARGEVITDSSGSISSVAVANALHFGMTDLNIGEIQALTKWWASRKEMAANHEGFSVSWWTINQTMDWLFTASRAK